MRLMTFNDTYPTVHGPLITADSIFSKLESLKIFGVYKYQVSKFIFKCINNIAPKHFQNWFVMSHKLHGYHTRSNINMTDGTKINKLFIPSARITNYGLKQIKVNGPRIWNTLPNNKKNSSTLHAFLSKLKLHYISQYRLT